jgi:hypothetical protein
MNFLKGKQVQVRITTDFWVAAVIVSVLEFCQKVIIVGSLDVVAFN